MLAKELRHLLECPHAVLEFAGSSSGSAPMLVSCYLLPRGQAGVDAIAWEPATHVRDLD